MKTKSPSPFSFALKAVSCLCIGSLACLIAFPSLLSASPATDDTVVTVSGGSIRGMLLPDNSGRAFRGIPFAQPPVGALRWREPQPVKPWTGVRDAFRPGPPAAQAAQGWNNDFAAASSEDCLYLDVWTPAKGKEERLPVMVWIHGGANTAGAGGSDALYEGQALIKRGVILVTVEYRVGILGFFAHPELTNESPHHASGNYGLLDQISALQWVHDNIGAFGGDPSKVTLFGQSAGSMDLLALMHSSLTKGLFRAAIAQSGAITPAIVSPLSEAEIDGVKLASIALPNQTQSIAQLRQLPASELLKIRTRLHPIVADGWVFPSDPAIVLAPGRAQPVPLMIGTAGIEFPAGGSLDEMRQAIRRQFGALAPKALALYGMAEGQPSPAPDPIYGNAADQLGSDNFRCASILLGEDHAKAGNPVWQYEFNRAIPPRPAVSHSGDLPYVFGNLRSGGSQGGAFEKPDHALSEVMQGYWTQFAKTGNPNAPGLLDWPRYEAAHCSYLVFTREATVTVGENERAAFRELYREAMAQK